MIAHIRELEGYEAPSPRRGLVKYLVDPERDGARQLLVGWTRLEVGARTEPAAHAPEEAYFILRGHARVRVDDDVRTVGPGTIIFIPKDARHEIGVSGEEPVEYVWMISPPPTQITAKQAWPRVAPESAQHE